MSAGPGRGTELGVPRFLVGLFVAVPLVALAAAIPLLGLGPGLA